MQSSALTIPDVPDVDTRDRRRPGRSDDVNHELVPLLREDFSAEGFDVIVEDNVPADDASVSMLARDPAAERLALFKILLIIVALVGVVMLFGK